MKHRKDAVAAIPIPERTEQAIERLRWQLDRSEGWINSADTKATIVMGLNAAVLGAVYAVDPGIVTQFLQRGSVARFFALALAAAVVGSISCAAGAVLPRLGKANAGGSVFHYLDIDLMTVDRFRSLSCEMTPADEVLGLEHQVFTVGKIAARKFRLLRFSVFGLLAGVLIGLLLTIVNNI